MDMKVLIQSSGFHYLNSLASRKNADLNNYCEIQPFCHIFVLWQFFPRLSASKNAGAVHNQSVQLRASVAAFFRRMRTDTISFRLTGKFDAETRSFLTKKNPTFRSYFANHFFRLSKPQTERLYVLIHIFYI